MTCTRGFSLERSLKPLFYRELNNLFISVNRKIVEERVDLMQADDQK